MLALHACAEGLLARDFLLSAVAACKLALDVNPREKMVLETLSRIHARAFRPCGVGTPCAAMCPAALG